MNIQEINLIMNTTKALKDMCSSNHQHTMTLNKEVQKLIKVIMDIEQRVSKLEKAND
tara:strand:+ start:19 stop:189 length:171 start_codon:yes stop_codon:yes gene_type:complete